MKIHKKTITKIFGVIFVLTGVISGVILVQKQQEIRKKAATCGITGTLNQCGSAGGCPSTYKCIFEDSNWKCVGSQGCPDNTCGITGTLNQCGSAGGCPNNYRCKFEDSKWQCLGDSSCTGTDSSKCSSDSNAKCDGKKLGDTCDTGSTCQKGTNIEYGDDGLIACKCKSGSGTTSPSGSSSPTASPSGSSSPTASPTTTASPIPNGVINIKFSLQGITTQKNNISISLSLKSTSESVWSDDNLAVSSDGNGVFLANIPESADIEPNDYNLLIKSSSHLQEKFTLQYNGSTQIFDFSQEEDDELLAGDVTNDNAISIEDISLVLKYYTDFSVPVNTSKADMVSSDINKDGFITIQDVALVALNWSDFTILGEE